MTQSSTNTKLDLQQFFPENLKIQEIKNADDALYIYLKSTTSQVICAHCGQRMKYHHAVHHRTAQDLPVFGKRTYLKIAAVDFKCDNPACPCVSQSDVFEGFLLPKSQMTERLVALVLELAVNTSCESAARIMQSMGIKISGDTVIRTLVKRYEKMTAPKSGNCIGIDDFALKKGQVYGTVVVDEGTHAPLALLEGRDGETVKKWLEQNKHVTAITRDRANAYAKAIGEILPDAMQIADRFHLYQNLMDAVKKVIASEIRAEKAREEADGKKNAVKCG